MKTNQISFQTIQISLEDIRDVLIVSKSSNVICNMTFTEGALEHNTYKVSIHRDVFNLIKLSKKPVDGILELFPLDQSNGYSRAEDTRPLYRFIPLNIVFNNNGSSKIPFSMFRKTLDGINSSYISIIRTLIGY